MRSLIVLSVFVIAAAQASFYGENSPVKSFDLDSFLPEVLEDKTSAWIIEFYAPWCGHCKKLTPEWEGAAKQLAKEGVKGIKLGAVDADAHKELGQKFEVEGFPTIKVFGYDKKLLTDYEGGRQQADIVATAKWQGDMFLQSVEKGEQVVLEAPKKERVSDGLFDDSEVVQLHDDNFDDEVKGSAPWLIEFYAPWCGHCKTLAPIWKELAGEVTGQIKIGAVDVTSNEVVGKKFGVQSFPTLKFFAPGAMDAPEDYNGGRDLTTLTEFCEGKAEEFPMKAVEVTQLKDDAEFKDSCLTKTLCVTFVLPHLMETGVSGRNTYLATLNAVAKKFSAKKVSFSWVQGGDHFDFEEVFAISANYPTFGAVGSKKMVYSTLAGKFDAATMIAKLQLLMGPRGTGLRKLAKIPEMEKGVELWDGKEYVAPAEEDE